MMNDIQFNAAFAWVYYNHDISNVGGRSDE